MLVLSRKPGEQIVLPELVLKWSQTEARRKLSPRLKRHP